MASLLLLQQFYHFHIRTLKMFGKNIVQLRSQIIKDLVLGTVYLILLGNG